MGADDHLTGALVTAARRMANRPGAELIPLLDPPFCYGPWRGPRIDLLMLRTLVRGSRSRGARAVVLSDIPDDDESLIAALSCDGVLGAIAVGCGWLDVWLREEVARNATGHLMVKRNSSCVLPRVVIHDPMEIPRLWALFEEVAGAMTQV
jgi:hypothetical protein